MLLSAFLFATARCSTPRGLVVSLALALGAVALFAGPALADERFDQARREASAFDELRAAGKYEECENYMQGLIEKYRRAGDKQLEHYLNSNLVDLYIQLDRIPEALPLAEATVRGCQEHWGPQHPLTGKALIRQGRVYVQLHRTDEALALLGRAREIAAATDESDGKDVNYVDGFIASALSHAGRYQEAERIRLRTLAWERTHSNGRPTEGVAVELHNLANLYWKQSRHPDAERLLLEANQVYIDANMATTLLRAETLDLLGDACKAQNRYADAAQHYEQAYSLYAKIVGPDHPIAAIQEDLADAYTMMGRLDEARPILLKSLKAAERHYGADSSQVYDVKYNLLTLYLMQRENLLAEKLADELVAYADRPHIPRGVLEDALTMRALAADVLEKFDEASKFGDRSIEILEEQRANYSGGEQQRAQSFSAAYHRYPLVAVYHFRNSQLAEGFAISERGRSRTLLEQMSLGQVDLFAGMPAEAAQRMRAAYEQLRNQTSELEQRAMALAEKNSLSDADRKQLAKLSTELDASRRAQAQAYAYIRNESPAFRRVAGENFAGASLDEVKAYLDKEKALLLYYIVSPSELVLLVVDGEDAAPIRILPAEDAAALLGVKPVSSSQEYGGKTFEKLLVDATNTGIVQLLGDPRSASVLSPKLEGLGQMLIPEVVRKILREGDYRRLIVVPDGPLSMLPFDALLMEGGPEPKYLLDVAPPIQYAPSATVLLNLHERPVVELPADRNPVLALGDPAYGPQTNQTEALDRAFRSRGGLLSQLPYSGLEATWVAENFDKAGMKTDVLRGRAATEAAVREGAPNRRIVHLACHGLTDDEHGNFFAALALAPGDGAKLDARNDGFLTLSELYELDLRACELSILSACQTNYGPQHDGEGVWAMSRSFLVAGSRRVVASNWLVDDKAGASLVSYFCGALSKQPAGETDYAHALADAKRWTRDQAEWKHPYYWATFVLIGPR